MVRNRFTGCVLLAILCAATSSSHGDVPAASGSAATATALCVSGPGGAVVPGTVAQWAEGSRSFDGLGTFHRTITTASPEAQAYFDQGMRFLWAFNHDEATRSFARAAVLDPGCASCFWGVALTVGPNYNLPMMAEPRAKVAFEALRKAQAAAAGTTPVEQALITALAARYPDARPLNPATQAPVLTNYAARMQDVAKSYPDDADVQTLTAEAMMTVNAWKLWALNGTPADGTLRIVAMLEGVLARNPQHPGANHYYIHAIEASADPERAVVAAERLRGMMPAAGHLEHMPAHIFQRVGRYADAAEANRNGADADLAYFAKTTPPDYYAMYTAHNYEFLAFSTAMQGRQADTLNAAKQSRAVVSDELALTMPGVDWYLAEQYAAAVRFGLWDAILAEPAPNPKLTGLTAGYRYARSVALAAKGRVAEARAELQALEAVTAAASPDDGAGLNPAKDVFAVAILVVRARIANAENNPNDSIRWLTEAVSKEDALAYDEPSDWFFPVRHMLGATLLKSGEAPQAEAVYRNDLGRHPGNGWALYGLAQALAAQHKDAEAQRVQRQFQAAWKDADVVLAASAF